MAFLYVSYILRRWLASPLNFMLFLPKHIKMSLKQVFIQNLKEFRKKEKMKITLDAFEQSIEDKAEQFIPLSDTEKNEVETIINDEKTILKSMALLRQ